MKRNIIGMAIVTVLSLLASAPARADLIIELGPANTQPPENLLFNEEGLIGQGLTVQGRTNQTSEVFDLTGREELETPAQGQARVDATADSELDFLLVDAMRDTVYFSEFEANLHVSGPTSGSFTVTACDQFGNCESETFGLGSGENFFSVVSVQGQLIDTVRFESTVEVDDVRQIRLGGVQELNGPPPQQVTEPALALVMTLGLVALVMARRKRSARRSGASVLTVAALAVATSMLGADDVRADLITFDNITGNSTASGAAGEAQLTATVELAPGETQIVRFCLFNDGPVSSSIKNVYFEDDLGLLDEVTGISGTGVDFSLDSQAGNLPGGNTVDFDTDFSFTADSPSPTSGVNPGDVLYLFFGLSEGTGLDDVLAALGSDQLRIGLHVIAYPNGQSEGFVSSFDGPAPPPQQVTEPSLIALMGLGLLALAARRMRA